MIFILINFNKIINPRNVKWPFIFHTISIYLNINNQQYKKIRFLALPILFTYSLSFILHDLLSVFVP